MSEFYFALPRLFASWAGRKAVRSEKSGLEANVVGAFNHLVVYVAAFELLLSDLPLWQQLLLLLPLAILVWLSWLILLYGNAVLIKLLRGAGFMRDWPDNRAQTFLIGITTTALAFALLRAGLFAAVLGSLWIAAVTLNFLAAALLSASHANRSANK